MRRGHVSAYVKRSDGGRDITREFCSVCGSGIDNRLARVPGVVVIKGGTLDEPSLVAPSFELYTRSKAACFGTNDELTSFDGDLTVDPATLAWKAPGRA